MIRNYNSSRIARAKSRSILTHCVLANVNFGRSFAGLRVQQLVIFGRTLCVALVVSLLATSSPTAAPTMVAFAKDSERSAVSWVRSNELSAKFYRGLAYGYKNHQNWTPR
ncbi:MAG: hypothetical protein H0U18_05145 [Pyrinomonadaceae bacterium]|nr:hypothetical protein [Pyrinomonadaceae bacterium]